MPKTKAFDPYEFLFDLYAMSKKKVNSLLLREIKKVKPNLEKIEVMIKSGLADVNANDEDENTPLHFASARNLIELAKLLIERGADVGAKDNGGWTPLHDASEEDNIEIAKLLIDAGADVNAKRNNGWTPLHLASDWNRIEIAKLLIEKGADVRAKDDYGKTPLDVAYSDEIWDILKNYKKRLAKKKNIV
jgi:ankyrin repeat protein